MQVKSVSIEVSQSAANGSDSFQSVKSAFGLMPSVMVADSTPSITYAMSAPQTAAYSVENSLSIFPAAAIVVRFPIFEWGLSGLDEYCVFAKFVFQVVYEADVRKYVKSIIRIDHDFFP